MGRASLCFGSHAAPRPGRASARIFGVFSAKCSNYRIISLFWLRGPQGAWIRACSPRMRIWRYATILSRALSNDLLFDFLSTPVWKRNGCCAARRFSEGCRPSAALACRGGGRVVAGRIRTGPMLGCGDSAHVRRLRPEAIRLPWRDRGAGRGPGSGEVADPSFPPKFRRIFEYFSGTAE